MRKVVVEFDPACYEKLGAAKIFETVKSIEFKQVLRLDFEEGTKILIEEIEMKPGFQIGDMDLPEAARKLNSLQEAIPRLDPQGNPPATSSAQDDDLSTLLGEKRPTFRSPEAQRAYEHLQKTGIAPTDDGFTLITRGAEEESSGSSTSARKEMPIPGLDRFGPAFLSRLRLKLRRNEMLEKVNLVDSPGMIDATVKVLTSKGMPAERIYSDKFA